MTSPGQNQQVFRTLLAAFSRPGMVRAFPLGITDSLRGVLACLVDARSSVYLWGGGDETLRQWLRQQGIPYQPSLPAEFVVCNWRDWSWQALASLPIGSEEAPEEGATLILCNVPNGPGSEYVLEGPGVQGRLRSSLPLPPEFLDAWQKLQSQYPRGVDVLLVRAEECIALPRSTHVEAAACRM